MSDSACGNVSAREAGWAAVSAAFGSLVQTSMSQVALDLGFTWRL